LSSPRLIAQNIANFRLPVNDGDLVPEASILNFHYAYPEVVDWNRGLRRVIGYDETGFAGKDDATYRRVVRWSDGRETRQGFLERPQLLIENGVPTHLFCATAEGPGIDLKDATRPMNIVFPLKAS
jgi:hypothetical protein